MQVLSCGLHPVPLARVLYLTRQHYRGTVISGEDNNLIVVNSVV